MGTLDQRVAFVEGRIEEQSVVVNGLRDAIAGLEERMDRRFEAVDRRLDGLDHKIDQRFAWLVGIQVTTLVAIVAALLAR